MSRIDSIFADLHARGGKALMPFVTAGYPSVEATGAMLPAIETGGASICELGIPFSDPIADGPTIQASMTAALDNHVHPRDIFAMVAQLRPKLNMGLVAMVSYSIVYRHGSDAFVAAAAEAGIDGFIVPDLPLEEMASLRDTTAAAGLTCSGLIAPTTPADRAAAIAAASTGFVYLVARTGITGERSELPPELPDRIRRLRDATDLPIAVGFGIANAQQVRAVVDVADAAIVGSALVKRITQHIGDPPDQLAQHIGSFVSELASGLQ